jgi:hypothetical protein
MKYYALKVEGLVAFTVDDIYNPEFFMKCYYHFLEDNYPFPKVNYVKEEPLYNLFDQSFMPGKGIFINDAVASILDNLNVKNGKVFKNIPIIPENKTIAFSQKYHYLQIVHFDITPYIDVAQSEFYKNLPVANTVYKFDTIHEFNKVLLATEGGFDTMPNVKTLYLNEAFWAEGIDVFFVTRLPIMGFQGLVVSEKVKKIFEENNITGVWQCIELPIFKNKF